MTYLESVDQVPTKVTSLQIENAAAPCVCLHTKGWTVHIVAGDVLLQGYAIDASRSKIFGSLGMGLDRVQHSVGCGNMD